MGVAAHRSRHREIFRHRTKCISFLRHSSVVGLSFIHVRSPLGCSHMTYRSFRHWAGCWQVPWCSVFALVQLALNLLHALNAANNSLPPIRGGLYHAHCPSCAIVFPSIACSHALTQRLPVFVCFHTIMCEHCLT